jgi:hypothetical protein
MKKFNVDMIRYFRTALILLIWYTLGSAAFSFSIQKITSGMINLVLVGIFVYILIDGRLFLRLKDREIRSALFVPMYALIIAILYMVYRDFCLTDLYVLDQLHLPGVISYIRAAGLIIIFALLTWETITITRLYLASRK